MPYDHRFAIVMAASTDIGAGTRETCTDNGFDLVVAADGMRIEQAARNLGLPKKMLRRLQADRSTLEE
jgi:hypothetical protein